MALLPVPKFILKICFPNVNGVASQVTGNLDALAALSLILASRLKFQGILARKWAEKCHSMLFNGNDRMQSNYGSRVVGRECRESAGSATET